MLFYKNQLLLLMCVLSTLTICIVSESTHRRLFHQNYHHPTLNIQPDIDSQTFDIVTNTAYTQYHEERLMRSTGNSGLLGSSIDMLGDWADDMDITSSYTNIPSTEDDPRAYHEILPPHTIPPHLLPHKDEDPNIVLQFTQRDNPLQESHYNLPFTTTQWEDEESIRGKHRSLLDTSILSTSASELTITVRNLLDSSTYNPDYCYPNPYSNTTLNPYYNPSQCNLRSAWQVCVQYSSRINDIPCTIQLPPNTHITMNVTLGALKVTSDMSVVINGHNATIQGIDNTYNQVILTNTFNGSTTSFPFTTTLLTNTLSATQNYQQACLPICPGITATFSTCAGATIGDTYLQLWPGAGGAPVRSNDNYCGVASQITYRVPNTVPLTKNGTCPIYCLRMGCSGTKTCQMTVNAYYLRPNATEPPPQFVSYIAPSLTSTGSSTSYSPPMLIFNNFTITSFGSLFYTGAGAINITGNASLTLSNMIFRDNQGTIGGAIAIVNNNYTHGVLTITQCSFIHNCASSEGGSIYLSRTTAPTTITSLYAINNHAIYGAFMSMNVNTSNINITNINAISNSATYSGSFIYSNKRTINVNIKQFTMINHWSYSNGLFAFTSNCTLISLEYGDVSGSTATVGAPGVYSTGNSSFFTLRHTYWEKLSGNYGIAAFTSNVTDVTIEYATVADCRMSGSGCIYISTNISNIVLRYVTMNYCINPSALSSCVLLAIGNNITMEYITMSNSFSKSDGCFIGLNTNIKNITFQHMILTNGTTYASAPFLLGTNSSTSILRNITMSNMIANTGGCIRFVRGNNATIQDLYLTNCTTRGTTSGGGLEIYIYPNVSISDVTITHSKTKAIGGGMAIDQSINAAITRVHISHCSTPSPIGGSASSGSGGGMYIGQLCNNLTLWNSSITHCSATVGGGLTINSQNNYVRIGGMTITNNYASNKGGGIYIGQYNYELILSDLQAFNEMKIYESPHPFIDSNPIVPGVRNVLYAANGTFPNANELIINFDQLSALPSIDLVNIYAFIPTSTTSNVLRKTLIYSGYNNFPGVTTPSLRIPGSSIYIELLGSPGGYVLSNGLYGIRLYVYPVIDTPVYPMLIQNNIAYSKGGGIFFFYVNSFSVLTNIQIYSNKVLKGDGGGISMQIGNGGTAMQQVEFINNTAYYDGGGLVLLSGQFGVTMRKCSFIHNVAITGSGGGNFLASSNGDGILIKNNNITCVLCKYINNTAVTDGGAIFLSDENYLSINSSTFEGNHVTGGDGGAIGLGGYGTAYFQDCIMKENTASNCGGGISAAKTSILYLTNITIQSNKALIGGGGLCLHTGTTMSLRGKILIQNNEGGFVGGGIALFQSPLWSIDSKHGSRLILSGNIATRGSALSIYQLETSINTINNVIFEHNIASQGNTVYWIYDTIMNNEPIGLTNQTTKLLSNSNQWYNNTVLYGGEIGTQAVYLITPSSYNVTIYGNSVNPPIEIKLYDYYYQWMTITGVTTIYPTLLIDTQKCSQYRFLSGNNMFGIGISMYNGIALFNNLEIYCSPLGNVTLSFQAEIGSLTAFPIQWRTPYYITNTTFLTFRTCTSGEYETKGMCQSCPLSTYNLHDRLTYACNSCQSTEGVSSCYGNQIIVKEGYWRRYSTNSAVMQCLLTPSSCIGGNTTSDASCAEGYSGPLCAVCSPGYFMSGILCLPCDGGKSEMTPTAIAVVLLIMLFIILTCIFVYFRYGRKKVIELKDPTTGEVIMTTIEPSTLELVLTWCKNKYNELMVKIKILVSTYQVIISTSTVFSVSMPITFTKFTNSLNFINLGFTSIFPLGCTKHFTYFDSLLWTTLIPLVLCSLLVLAFIMEYIIVRNKIQLNKQRKRGEKRKAFNRVKSKYLSFMFYLTYLVLPSVTTTIFQAFICTNIDPNNEDNSQYDWYLTADMSISCQSDEYYSWLPYVVVMIIIYPIGIPAIYFCFLYYNKEEIQDRERIIKERIEDEEKKQQEKELLEQEAANAAAAIAIPIDGLESPSQGNTTNGKRMSSLRLPSRSGSVIGTGTGVGGINAVGTGIISRNRTSSADNTTITSTNPLHSTGNRTTNSSDDITSRNDSISSRRSSSISSNKRYSSTSSNNTRRKGIKQEIVLAWEQAQSDIESGNNIDDDDDLDDVIHNEIDEESHLTVSATRLMFLWQSYKPIYWYFELVETTRRIMLTAVLSVCSPGSSSQSVLGVILSFLYLLYYGIHQPYDEKSDFILAEIGQIQIFFTFFSALIVQNNLLNPLWVAGLGILLTIVNLSIVFITLHYEIINYRNEQHEKEEQAKAVRQRVLSIVGVQRKMFIDKLRTGSIVFEDGMIIDDDGEGQNGGDVGDDGERRMSPNISTTSPKTVFRKKTSAEMMVTPSHLVDDEDSSSSGHNNGAPTRPSGGIELQEFRSSKPSTTGKPRLSDVKIDSDDEDSDDEH